MVEKIKADLKKIRRGKVFAAIISLVIGVVLLVYPMTSLEVIVRMIGIALIISGLYAVLMFIVNGEDRSVGALIGGILTMLGLIMAFYLLPLQILAVRAPEEETWKITAVSRKGGAVFRERFEKIMKEGKNEHRPA